MTLNPDDLVTWLLSLAACIVTAEKALATIVHYRSIYANGKNDVLQNHSTALAVLSNTLNNGLKDQVAKLVEITTETRNRLERVETTLAEMRRTKE